MIVGNQLGVDFRRLDVGGPSDVEGLSGPELAVHFKRKLSEADDASRPRETRLASNMPSMHQLCVDASRDSHLAMFEPKSGLIA